MSVTITGVKPHSHAAWHRIHPGDRLLSVNAHEICDVLDYRFYITEKRVELKLETRDGRQRTVVMHKKETDDTGLVFSTYLMDGQQQCKNKCIFCFIDQMPPGMRKSLYFKDDDSRLSFLFGNYITLTGLSEREAQRIIDMHISPVNISVHTVNPDLRVEMMKNPKAGESLYYLKKFAAAGISMNTQLVLCPGINDGKELERSLEELSKLYPAVQSIAAVPVGLTKYRDGLYPLEPYNKQTASQVLDTVNRFGEKFLKENGTRLAYAADEFYIKAEREIPGYDYYEEFAQLENGVGMWALLENQFNAELEGLEGVTLNRTVSAVTGEAAYPLINKLCGKAEEKYNGLKINLYKIKNEFFGDSVTVTGLITGGDIINQLKGKPLGEKLIIPEVMLKSGENIFLDDISTEDIEKELNIKVCIQPKGAHAMLEALTGMHLDFICK
ncbi:MAG: DUF512 domain-containing protein [Clostridia bacterium]|nr:DUF512 domain-containing protein [Clostridia bacterium]